MCTLFKFDTQNNAIPRYYTQNIQENLVNFDILRCPPQKPRRFNLVFFTYKVKNDLSIVYWSVISYGKYVCCYVVLRGRLLKGFSCVLICYHLDSSLQLVVSVVYQSEIESMQNSKNLQVDPLRSQITVTFDHTLLLIKLLCKECLPILTIFSNIVNNVYYYMYYYDLILLWNTLFLKMSNIFKIKI